MPDGLLYDVGPVGDHVGSKISFEKRIPFSSYAYVDVTFGSADTDYIIEHSLKAKNPELIRWITVTNDTSGVVYRDNGTPPRAWGEGYIVLKCSAANANVRLLLFLEKDD